MSFFESSWGPIYKIVSHKLHVNLVGAMDTFARGLRSAVKIIDEGVIGKNLKVRYFATLLV